MIFRCPFDPGASCGMFAGMETAIANMLEPGETIVVGNNGIWGERICDIA